MIIIHKEDGRVENIIFDPIAEGMIEVLDEQGLLYVIFESDEFIDPGEIYVDEGVVTARPSFEGVPDEIALLADGQDEVTIENLPDPCLIVVENEEITVEGGILTIKSEMPAEYVIGLLQFPYKPFSIKVTVNAPQS